jgi:hypothetical protein
VITSPVIVMKDFLSSSLNLFLKLPTLKNLLKDLKTEVMESMNQSSTPSKKLKNLSKTTLLLMRRLMTKRKISKQKK